MKNKYQKKKRKKNNDIDALKKRVNEQNFLSAVIDEKNSQIRVYTKDMLIKRCKRDSPKIARSFDRVCRDEISEMSERYAMCVSRIGDGFFRSMEAEDDFAIECSKLLMNASKTIGASFELLRAGYFLQPGMLLRSVVEVFCLISFIHIEEDGFKKYKEDGKFDINKTIRYGKELIPPLGYFQGMLSNEFVHIGDLHTDLSSIAEYTEMIPPLRVNLDIIKTAIWLTYIISELSFFQYFETHEFWTQKGENQFALDIDKDMEKWLGGQLKEKINDA